MFTGLKNPRFKRKFVPGLQHLDFKTLASVSAQRKANFSYSFEKDVGKKENTFSSLVVGNTSGATCLWKVLFLAFFGTSCLQMTVEQMG
jgi:hypothetical protein